MGMIEDLDRGVLERFLATPAHRGAIVFGRILESSIVATFQAVLILVTVLFLGARNGGVAGWLVILVASFLIAAGFAGFSHGIALLTRQDATMIAIAQFVGLPLPVRSSLLIARELIPGWMQTLSLLNPVEWAVRAARGEALPGTDWGEMGTFILLLLAFAGATAVFSDLELPFLSADAVGRRRFRLLAAAQRESTGPGRSCTARVVTPTGWANVTLTPSSCCRV